MRNPIYYTIEKNRRVYTPYQNDDFCENPDYCKGVFCELLVKYGTDISDNINKNSNAYSMIRQGFKAYILDRQIINTIVYEDVCERFKTITPQTRVRCLNVMRLFNFINTDKYVILT